MSYNNLPPGITERDIPGYLDAEVEIKEKCLSCGYEGDFDVTVTPGFRRYDDAIAVGECPACGEECEFTIEAEIPDPEPDDYYEGRPYGRL